MTDANTAVTLPHPNPPAEKVFKKTLPCYVILVHGVNDMGECYQPQEKGICWGLSERLGRDCDLQPHEYKVPRDDRRDPLEPVPDRTYYHRVAGSGSHSPVIPFYWGFREEDAKIIQNAWHGELLDQHYNRLDHDGAKNGGAFVNACNCLPHMWAGGWKPDLKVKIGNATAGSPTHDLKEAPDRRYQVLAALRLAMLIRIIRKRHPEIAINVAAHSMGCLVSLLAQVFLMDDGDQPADCVVMNNPPYSFNENSMDDGLFKGMNQTSRARIETLKKIVGSFHEKRAKKPDWKGEVQNLKKNPGLAWEPWVRGIKKAHQSREPMDFVERDNRGKIYLYFTPHDRTVALFNTQGIGWQGVPDRFTAQWLKPESQRRLNTYHESRTPPIGDSGTPPNHPPNDPYEHQTWTTLLQDLQASGFRQRIFLRQVRHGKLFQVGLSPQHVSLRESGDTYPKAIEDIFVRASIAKGTMRGINGEPLAPPIDYDPGPDLLPITPIDAAIALAHGGAFMVPKVVDDPRPPQDRGPIYNSDQHEPIRMLLNKGKPLEQCIPSIRDITQTEDGNLSLMCISTPDETREYWQSQVTEDNSHHSSIVSHHWHSQTVTAYDLAVAKPILWTEEEKKFYAYLCEVADWRIKVDKPGDPKARPRAENKLKPLAITGFYEKEDPGNKALINATATYYVDGTYPPQIDQAKTPDKLPALIHCEATGHRAPADI